MEQQIEQPPFALHVGLLKNIDLSVYPKEKTHYLAYALQYGLKPPSKSTMNRSERRNMNKSGATKAAQATGKTDIVNIVVSRRKRRFFVPNRFGEKIVKKARSSRRMRRGRGRGREHQQMAKKPPVFRPGRVIPGRKPISLPVQIVRKQKKALQPKELSQAFQTKSPQWLQLRAAREKFREEIEKYREANKKGEEGEVMKEEKTIPEYFRKKKASQKRRRLQKHQLIQANKQALVEIFGTAVFQKGWPISRREIKLALGIKEEDHDKVISLEQFMKASNAMEEEK